jgi:hypothetical protein
MGAVAQVVDGQAAAARLPSASAASTLSASKPPVSSHSVPSTATRPKKISTVSSPSGV